MASIVRNGRESSEKWPLLDAASLAAQAAGGASNASQADVAGILVPLQVWLEQPAAIEALGMKFGVVLQATDDPAVLARYLDRIPVIAISFARFADGRGYSIARLLRDRYRYRGELRAIGDVLRDQLFYLKRVGFDAFQLRDDQDVPHALGAFDDFTERYQASSDQPLPLFQRRVA